MTVPGDLDRRRRGRRPAPATRFPALLAAAAAELAGRFDATWGGFGPAPKFPQPALLELCLEHGRASPGDRGSLAMAETTLEAMAAGGIYDHLGGGFARYSTDRRLDGPPLREDALRPGRTGPRLPARLATTGDDRWQPGGGGDRRLRAAGPGRPGGGLYSRRGRRLRGRGGSLLPVGAGPRCRPRPGPSSGRRPSSGTA